VCSCYVSERHNIHIYRLRDFVERWGDAFKITDGSANLTTVEYRGEIYHLQGDRDAGSIFIKDNYAYIQVRGAWCIKTVI
jgi:hypothetical protein